MASQESVDDSGAQEPGPHEAASSLPKHFKICRIAVKEHFGSHCIGNFLFCLLHGCVEALEEAVVMTEKHQEEIHNLAKVYKERLDIMLVPVEALHSTESCEKKITETAPTNLPPLSS